jgi:exopolysaccharide biosynthesis protein
MKYVNKNYVNIIGGGFKKTNREVGWVIKNGEWWADYADRLEWYEKSDGFWIQRYKSF